MRAEEFLCGFVRVEKWCWIVAGGVLPPMPQQPSLSKSGVPWIPLQTADVLQVFVCAHPRLGAAMHAHMRTSLRLCAAWLLNAMPPDRYIDWQSERVLRATPHRIPFSGVDGKESGLCLLWLSSPLARDAPHP